MHQDHVPDTCYSAAINGFTSVMMDGFEADAKTPASYDHNVNVTKKVADRPRGREREGELGRLGLETGKVKLKTATVSKASCPRTCC